MFVIQHNMTKYCWHPEDAGNKYGTELYNKRIELRRGCSGPWIDNSGLFIQLPNGALQNVENGMCVHFGDDDTTLGQGADLKFRPNCDSSALKVDFLTTGLMRNTKSGRCVHPDDGDTPPAEGTHLHLWDNCNNEARLKYTLLYVPQELVKGEQEALGIWS